MSDNPYQQANRERRVLAIALAVRFGWPADPDAVLERLRGDRTTAILTFGEDAMVDYYAYGTPQDDRIEGSA